MRYQGGTRLTFKAGNDLILSSVLVVTKTERTYLANELPRYTVRLDLREIRISVQCQLKLPGLRARTMINDLSDAVPFSPAIVFAPSSRMGTLAANGKGEAGSYTTRAGHRSAYSHRARR